jgi:hypothetical protein
VRLKKFQDKNVMMMLGGKCMKRRVFVNFNSEGIEYIKSCLDNLLKITPIDYEAWISDMIDVIGRDGYLRYEIRSYYSKDGCPHILNFSLNHIIFEVEHFNEYDYFKANCCNDLNEVVSWFKRLKSNGVEKSEILDVLEFDSDQYPNFDNLEKAKEIVYGGDQ